MSGFFNPAILNISDTPSPTSASDTNCFNSKSVSLGGPSIITQF